jgi:hypothetical protein
LQWSLGRQSRSAEPEIDVGTTPSAPTVATPFFQGIGMPSQSLIPKKERHRLPHAALSRFRYRHRCSTPSTPRTPSGSRTRHSRPQMVPGRRSRSQSPSWQAARWSGQASPSLARLLGRTRQRLAVGSDRAASQRGWLAYRRMKAYPTAAPGSAFCGSAAMKERGDGEGLGGKGVGLAGLRWLWIPVVRCWEGRKAIWVAHPSARQ